jgi:hypothetical protein
MLLDEQGHVIGMVTFNVVRSSGQTVPRLSFALPFRMLRALIEFAAAGGLSSSACFFGIVADCQGLCRCRSPLAGGCHRGG